MKKRTETEVHMNRMNMLNDMMNRHSDERRQAKKDGNFDDISIRADEELRCLKQSLENNPGWDPKPLHFDSEK